MMTALFDDRPVRCSACSKPGRLRPPSASEPICRNERRLRPSQYRRLPPTNVSMVPPLLALLEQRLLVQDPLEPIRTRAYCTRGDLRFHAVSVASQRTAPAVLGFCTGVRCGIIARGGNGLHCIAR